jgi:hypothetical protein
MLIIPKCKYYYLKIFTSYGRCNIATKFTKFNKSYKAYLKKATNVDIHTQFINKLNISRKDIKMKKLMLLTSAIVAGFAANSQADVTVSGAADIGLQSVGTQTWVGTGGSIAFGLSQDLGNGWTVSSTGLSLGIDSTAADASIDDADAFHGLTFSNGGSSITVRGDLEGDTTDIDVGRVAGDLVSKRLATQTASVTDGNLTGNGMQVTTSIGSAALTVNYLWDNNDVSNANDINASANEDSFGASVSLPVGPLAATLAYSADNSTSATHKTSAASVSYAAPQGTLSAAYITDNATANSSEWSVAYSTTLADATSIKVGYTSAEKSAQSSKVLEASLSRSIGTGASMFVDFTSLSGDLTTSSFSDKSAVAIGSSFTF